MAGGPGGNFQNPMGQFNSNLAGLGMGLDGQSQTFPRGHGRRHSVNVVNKNGGAQPNANSSTFAFPSTQDNYDDGFTPSAFNGGHSRQVSRADSTWRISEFSPCNGVHRFLIQLRWRCRHCAKQQRICS